MSQIRSAPKGSNGYAVYEINEDEKTDTEITGYMGDGNTTRYRYADGGQSYDGKPIQYTPDTLPQMPESMA